MKTMLRKIWNRLGNEITWARLDVFTSLYYCRRKTLMACESSAYRGGNFEFCDLAVVAFNNSEVIDYQIRSLRKFFKYPFRYTVFDNSTHEQVADEILAVCKKYGVGYVRLPKQEFLPKGFGSYSHGIACNYLFRNFVRKGGQNTSCF